MTEQTVIQKDRALEESQDYYFLREKGLAYIQSLSGSIWTDHNLHDPGITTLEILCYALTDLGYRTGFRTVDLLVDKNDNLAPDEISGLFPAHEVLPTAPLTIMDYRRLLLKIEGVRNAWLTPLNDFSQPDDVKDAEIPVYIDCQGGGLSFESTNELGNPNQRLKLNGLYNVLLELEIDDELGPLSQTQLTYQVKRKPLKGVVLSLDCEGAGFIDGKIDFSKDFNRLKSVSGITRISDRQFTATASVEAGSGVGGATAELDQLVIHIINDKPDPDAAPLAIDKNKIKAVLEDKAADALIKLFWRKQQERKKRVDCAARVLHAHRNLCEDYFSIQTVESEQVAFCADIEVKPDADLEEAQARIFHAIENYFNPPIRYFTLKQMLDDGLCGDEIFNGPYADPDFRCDGEAVFTKAGFIKTEDLEESELRRALYVSDIINLIMDLEAVVAVRNALLRKYDADGNPAAASEKWCLPITANHQPVLYKEQAKIIFFKNQAPYRASDTEYLKTLEHLRALDRKSAYVAPNQVLELPRGEFRHPDQFFSIQHDYPKTFGIGEAGMPDSVKPDRVAKRTAQARQFKAYLTFYDQILANYLSQLANVHRLFSLDKNLKQTYFWQYLKDISSVWPKDQFEIEFYDLMPEAAPGVNERNPLIEDEDLFQDRRNRVLDHLMARFAEQFNDYVWMMYSASGKRLKADEQLIDPKIDFLSEYPIISRERSKAFNYRPRGPGQVWDTDNVSGLQKRVSRLLGIENYWRRNLSCTAICDELFSVRKQGDKFRLEIKSAQNTILFKSAKTFPNKKKAMEAAANLCPFLRQQDSYRYVDSGGKVSYKIVAGGESIQYEGTFNTRADAARSIRAVIARHDEILLSGKICNDEGFHLVEHILLRPMGNPGVSPADNTDERLAVCLDPGCSLCGDEDPYSFRITVLLPYWPVKFQDPRIRRHIENTLRQETPAHIHARICWIDNRQMAEFEEAYSVWLKAKTKISPSSSRLRAALNNLISVMKRLKSIYPAATLHDCVEDMEDHPVRLGNTNLGIF